MKHKTKTIPILSLACSIGATIICMTPAHAGQVPFDTATSSTMQTASTNSFFVSSSNRDWIYSNNQVTLEDDAEKYSYTWDSKDSDRKGRYENGYKDDNDYKYDGKYSDWSLELINDDKPSNSWNDFDSSRHHHKGNHPPVPIPPAVLLFGSAVLGLVAVSRRKTSSTAK